MWDNLFWLLGPVFSSAILLGVLGVFAIPAFDCRVSQSLAQRRHVRI
jgi:hypothetical protein